MFLWLFNVYMYAVMKEMKKDGSEVSGEGERLEMPGFIYADDFSLCDESEEDVKVRVGCFVEVCRRRGLKVNANKSKVMVLGGEEELKCEIHVDIAWLEQI